MCRYTKRSAAICPFERRSAQAYIPQSYAPQQGYDPYGGYAAPYPPAGYEPYAAAPYPPQGYAAPAYGAPYYDPYTAPAYDPRYSAPYPPNAYYAPQPVYPPYPPQGSAPAPEAPYAPPQPEMPRAPQPEYEAAFYGSGIPAPEGLSRAAVRRSAAAPRRAGETEAQAAGGRRSSVCTLVRLDRLRRAAHARGVRLCLHALKNP